MKERQRWQPEEDALLRAYVKQYGPREWNLVSQRMGKTLDRDAKSCLERWKNYLKPGIKKGSLTEEEQSLVISLQAKYGNKWKKIAAEVPGRTAKRLGKWWEVFKEKQLKERRKERQNLDSANSREGGKYDHILETFAEKYVQKKICPTSLPPFLMPCPSPSPILTLSVPTGSTYADNICLANVKTTPSVSTSPVVSQMPNLPESMGLALPVIKGKVPSAHETEPRLTLESLSSTRPMLEPELALQCSASAMDLELTPPYLGTSSSAVDAASTLPPWMSNVPTAQVPASGGSDVKTSGSAFMLEKDSPFLSKPIHLNSSPSVSLSLSPSSSDPVVSSGSASPASEVIAPRSWLQDTMRHQEIINGVAGGVANEKKVNFPWRALEKQVGTSSFDPKLASSKQAMDNLIMQQLPSFLQYCKDLEEGRQSWFMHKKEATWRLSRLEQQLESEKARKRREKIEEVGAKIRALREEEITYLDKLETECREQLSSLQRDAEMKEAKMMELWAAKHLQLTKFVEQMLYQFPDAQRLFSKDMH
uniref:Asymmetric leaves 1 n=1 Tax=Keteleeria evelyniana TaxID=123598 RepID=A0A7M3VDW3_9CONI|nr:asymmetric leaves 1 [Keteleeria evelyniana]